MQADARGLGGSVFVDDGKLEAVAEVDEARSVSREVEIDAAVLVVVLWIRGAVRIGEAEAARIGEK